MKAQALAEYALTLAAGALLLLGLFDLGRAVVDVLRMVALQPTIDQAAAAGAQAGALFPECAASSCSDIVRAAVGDALAGLQLAGAPAVIISESVIRETTIAALRVQVCAALQPVSVLGGLLAGEGLELCAESQLPYVVRRR